MTCVKEEERSGFSKESNFTNKTISESIVRPTSKPLKINEVPRTNFKLDSKGDFGGGESGLSIHSPRRHGDRRENSPSNLQTIVTPK